MNAIRLTMVAVLTLASIHVRAQHKELELLKFMEGEWAGEGWMEKGNEKITFTSQERIRFMAEGACIALEGLGKRVDGAASGEIVHSAFAVITFNKDASQYMIKGYKLNVETTFVRKRERVWEWSVTNSHGFTFRFVFDFSAPDQWIETGEYEDDVKAWHPFMEIRFKRDHSLERGTSK